MAKLDIANHISKQKKGKAEKWLSQTDREHIKIPLYSMEVITQEVYYIF